MRELFYINPHTTTVLVIAAMPSSTTDMRMTEVTSIVTDAMVMKAWMNDLEFASSHGVDPSPILIAEALRIPKSTAWDINQRNTDYANGAPIYQPAY